MKPSLALSSVDLADLRSALENIARQAGAMAMHAFRPGSHAAAKVFWKDGGSPVTEMDLAVDAYLRDALHKLAPGVAYHSEERPESWALRHTDPAFVIDPIDGTRAFMSGRDDWCIAIGMVEAGAPILGLIHGPAQDEMFSAHHQGGARLNGARLVVQTDYASPLTVSGPQPMLDHVNARLSHALIAKPRVAALAYRLVKPLTGAFDLALARPGAHDWDIVGADCILNEAGASLVDPHGQRPFYALEGGEHGVLFAGSLSTLDKIRTALLTKKP